MSTITVLTDFGLDDPYVGTMKGVILSIHPAATIVDITHEVEPQGVEEACFLIPEYYPYFPLSTVHLCVIDPTVGSSRRGLVVSQGSHVFVGPDNGIFTFVLRERAEAFAIEKREFMLPEVSATFQGRDVFAPAAAHLANGVKPEEMGPRVFDAVLLDNLLPVQTPDRLEGRIVRFDRFGNAISNVRIEAFTDFTKGGDYEVELRDMSFSRISRSYYEHPVACLVGSSGFLEFGSFRGNLRVEKGLARGDAVKVKRK